MLASTNETMITPAARKMARFLAGKGVPSGRAKGMVSTPARVIAPRTPAKDIAATSRQLICGGVTPRRAARNMFQRSETHTHMNRSTARAAVMART